MKKVGYIVEGDDNSNYAYLGNASKRGHLFLDLTTLKSFSSKVKFNTSKKYSRVALDYRNNIASSLPKKGQEFLGIDDNDDIDLKLSTTFSRKTSLKKFNELEDIDKIKTAFTSFRGYFCGHGNSTILDIGHIVKGQVWCKKTDTYFNVIGLMIKYERETYYSHKTQIGVFPIYFAKKPDSANITCEFTTHTEYDNINTFYQENGTTFRITEQIINHSDLTHFFNRIDKSVYETIKIESES